MATDGKPIEELEKEVNTLENQKKQLILQKEKMEQDLLELEKRNGILEKKLTKYRNAEQEQKEKIENCKFIEKNLLRKEELTKQIAEVEIIIEKSKQKEGQIQKQISEAELLLEQINQKYLEVQALAKQKTEKTLTKVKNKFSKFVNMATNGEKSAYLSEKLIPVLDGRTIFSRTVTSQFERVMMDYAFRISLLSVCGEATETTPSLLLETPDEVTDEAYLAHFAKAISHFASNLSVIITTVNLKMVEELFTTFDSQERKNRLTILLSTGTLTQKKFYDPKLFELLSEK